MPVKHAGRPETVGLTEKRVVSKNKMLVAGVGGEGDVWDGEGDGGREQEGDEQNPEWLRSRRRARQSSGEGKHMETIHSPHLATAEVQAGLQLGPAGGASA